MTSPISPADVESAAKWWHEGPPTIDRVAALVAEARRAAEQQADSWQNDLARERTARERAEMAHATDQHLIGVLRGQVAALSQAGERIRRLVVVGGARRLDVGCEELESFFSALNDMDQASFQQNDLARERAARERAEGQVAALREALVVVRNEPEQTLRWSNAWDTLDTALSDAGAIAHDEAVRAQEREACAGLAESWGEPRKVWEGGPDEARNGIASDIRARKS